jgi:BirA family transcriptional regulator, biotin operon repressor / biotin---[acetyl-CoA-carboxylase] ligase
MLSTLLNLMSDGRFHSGEALGAALGVSRAAVWKVLSPLESQGFPIQRVRGKGYRIPPGAVLLDEHAIRSFLPEHCSYYWTWHVYQQIDSTNAEAQRLMAGQQRPLACVSEQQSAGRGRRGRAWVSPYAQNIYLSITEPFNTGAQGLEGLSLVVGIALAETLQSCGYEDVALKWPNDVLLDGRKLAGILIEIAGDLTSDCVVVIGVGINVLMGKEAGESIDQAWTSLLQSSSRGELNRNRLVAVFVQKVLEAMTLFRAEGFRPFGAAWERHDAWFGQMVDVVSGAHVISGRHIGVNERGALRLETADGEVLANGGEVSLRKRNAS